MTIRVVDELESGAWDDFIKLIPSAGPFHTRAWTECFKGERLTPIYLRVLSDEQPIGGIAGVIAETRLPWMRRFDRSVTFFSGPALAEMRGATIRDCMLGLRRYAEDRGLTSLISLGRDYPYAYDWGDAKVHLQVIHEYIVDLRGASESVTARMRKSIP